METTQLMYFATPLTFCGKDMGDPEAEKILGNTQDGRWPSLSSHKCGVGWQLPGCSSPGQITPVTYTVLARHGLKINSHSHYGTTTNNAMPLLAFADGHATLRDGIGGHLGRIGCRAGRHLHLGAGFAAKLHEF